MNGILSGGWSYVLAAYAISIVVLTGYVFRVIVASRAEERR